MGNLQVLHSRDVFNDNGDGTLSRVRQADPDDVSFQPYVVSQTSTLQSIDSVSAPPRPPADALQDKRQPEVDESNPWPHTAQYVAPWGKRSGASSPDSDKVSIKSEGSPVIPKSTALEAQAPLYVHYPGTAAIRTAMATSRTWEILELFVTKMGGKRGWLTAPQGASGLERHALIQLLSLPPRNKIEREWLDGISNAHQRLLKGLICILVSIVGTRGPCEACKNRVPEKRRHCAALPPQAENMKELQLLLGNKCSECYHTPTKGDCGFPLGASIGVKQSCTLVSRPEKSDTAQSLHSQAKFSTQVDSLTRPESENATTSIQRVLKTSVASPPVASAEVILLQSRHSQTAFRQMEAPKSHKDSVSDKKESSNRPEETITASERDVKRGSTLSAADERGSRSTHVTKTPKALPDSGTNKTKVKLEKTDIDSSSATLVSKALGLLTEVSHLANEERSGVYNKIAKMVDILRRPTSGLDNPGKQPQGLITEEWESAPGRLTVPQTGTVQEKRIAFSTSYLRREVVDVELATRISRGQRVINRNIPASHQVTVERFDARWHCTLTVLEGRVEFKMGQVEDRMVQGGILIIHQDLGCSITNVTRRDCLVQIRWVDE